MKHRTPRSRPLGRVYYGSGAWHVVDALTGGYRISVGPGFRLFEVGNEWFTEGIPASFDSAAYYARGLSPGLYRNAVVRL